MATAEEAQGIKRLIKKRDWGTLFILLFLLILPLVMGTLSDSSYIGQKFSMTAIVYSRDYPADKNIINLDNVGTLRPYNMFYEESPDIRIKLALNFPVTVLSDRMAPMSKGSAYMYQKEPDSEDVFIFNVLGQKSHEIEVAGRTFLVTLFNIRDLSISDIDTQYEYQFGVVEK
jgi:hypothetical protein